MNDESLSQAWRDLGPFVQGCSIFLAGAGLITLALLWRWWRRRGGGFGGVMILFPVIYTLAYAVGSYTPANKAPLYGAYVDAGQWLQYAIGLIAFFAGAGLYYVFRRPALSPPGGRAVDLDRLHRWAMVTAAIGVAASFANFATGRIALLSDNIQAARFTTEGSSTGVLGRYWLIIIGVNEFSFLLLAVLALFIKPRRFNVKSATALTLLAAVMLLTGGRSFLVLVVLALGLVWLERRRVGAIRLAALGAVLLLALGAFGYARSYLSGAAGSASADAEAAGYGGGPVGTALASIAVGPRVFWIVRQQIPRTMPYQHGSWMIRDGSQLMFRRHVVDSAHWVTVNVMDRDPSQTGGLPPTILGGFYIDGGTPGIVLGMALVGVITAALRRRFIERPNTANTVAFGYWASYLILALYSYISLKTSAVIFFALCLLLAGQSVSTERVGALAGFGGTVDRLKGVQSGRSLVL